MLEVPINRAAGMKKNGVDPVGYRKQSNCIPAVEAMVTRIKVRRPAECLLLARSQPMIVAISMDSRSRNRIPPIDRFADQGPSNAVTGSDAGITVTSNQ